MLNGVDGYSQDLSQLQFSPSFSHTAIQHSGFSPFVKSGNLWGINIAYTKLTKNPWFLQMEFHSGNLNSDIDGDINFFNFLDFEMRFAKLFGISEKLAIGPSFSLLDGFVGKSRFSNNTYLHDATIPSIAFVARYASDISEKLTLENQFIVDALFINSRNEFSGRPSIKFRFSSPSDRLNLSNKLTFLLKTPKSNLLFTYRFAYMRNNPVDATLFQHGFEFGVRYYYNNVEEETDERDN